MDTEKLRRYIDKHGPPLSPMLIFTLLDEVDKLRDQVALLERTFVQPVLDRIREEG